MALKAYIVEDNPAIRESLVDALAELAGIETVGQATTAQDAAVWLAHADHAWDIAIVDNTPNPDVPVGGDLLPTNA